MNEHDPNGNGPPDASPQARAQDGRMQEVRMQPDGTVGGGAPQAAADDSDGAKDGMGARKLDDASQTSIEDRLRSMFDQVASEPVPDRFMDLLDKLERSEKREQ